MKSSRQYAIVVVGMWGCGGGGGGGGGGSSSSSSSSSSRPQLLRLLEGGEVAINAEDLHAAVGSVPERRVARGSTRRAAQSQRAVL